MIIKQNLTSGQWAVAMTGYRGWRRTSALGDGITSAHNALITRCESRAEAEQLAARLNDGPSMMPGQPDVPEYDARRYRRDDYLSRQSLRFGSRDIDRRIACV